MTHDELNALLKKEAAPAKQPFKTLVDTGFMHLSPTAFEAFVLEIFETFGFSGSLTPSSGDEGVDIRIRSKAGLIVVQCKKYDDNGTIGGKELREFFGALVHFQAVHGYFVTTSTFTEQAQSFARQHDNITLIDGESLKKLFLMTASSIRSMRIDGETFPGDMGVCYQAQAEGLYKEYIKELEKLRDRFRRAAQ
ncbi:MAG: restriction endonuclease [Syntrophorhabdales bacterium]|jgi:HJR/Mrr/RecB family endonuclease